MKAILVFDMPATCTGCPCYDYIHGVCANTHKDCELRIQEKPVWCPARPLPERKDEGSVLKPLPFEVYMYRYGFNECLDEIIGEAE